jgi:hypothetical protein
MAARSLNYVPSSLRITKKNIDFILVISGLLIEIIVQIYHIDLRIITVFTVLIYLVE